MKKLLIFDLMGVVFENISEGSAQNIKCLFSKCHNPPIDFDTFYEKYELFALGKITRDDFWEGFDNYNEIEKEHLNTYEISERLVHFINQAKDDYTVVALTNHPKDWIDYLNAKFHLDNLFQQIFVSGDLKVKKPSSKAFQLVLDKLGFDPSAAVLIDDQKKNVQGAKKAGMESILYEGQDLTGKF